MARRPHLLIDDMEEFLPMVRYWARHYSQHSRHHCILDYEDLQVVGMMGLLDAARRYNPKHNVLFKTYAEFRIRGEIVDELRRQDWMSRGERKKQKLYRQAQQVLQQNLGRQPTRTELARVLPFKSLELDRMHLYELHDVERCYQEGDGHQAELEQDQLCEHIIARDEVATLLKSLPPIHRLILQRRYFDEAPLAKISQEIGLTEGRISQLHSEALAMLRQNSQAA